jgi:hypothetical protein
MASDAFLAFVKGKLVEHGSAKVIPAKDRLEEAFRLFARGEGVRQVVEEIITAQTAEDVAVPEDLEQRAKNYLEQNPEVPWAEAVRSLAEGSS